jgi:hypothetical protein
MEPPRQKTAEYLGTVKTNNGQHQAELRRESDPGGSTVAHAVRKPPYVHERWHSAGKLDPDLFSAGRRESDLDGILIDSPKILHKRS